MPTKTAPSKTAPTKPASEGKGGRTLVYIQGVLCGGLAAFAMPVALLLVGLSLPGLVTLRLDRMPGKPLARALLLAGLAATVDPARTLLRNGMTVTGALDQLTDPTVVGIAWGGAAFAWLLAEAIPLFVEIVAAARAAQRITELETARTALVERWGLQPSAETRATQMAS